MADQPPSEFIRYLTRHMQLSVDKEELPVLEQVIQANEEYLAVMDAAARSSGEDPLGFMRALRMGAGSDAS